MTQEEKQLLLRDICCRLPYGVILANGIKARSIDILTKIVSGIGTDKKIEDTKYYLRPMSSMTDEEKNIYYNPDNRRWNEWEWIDWFNSHHLDYRNLIEKKLALEAPEGMYK